MTRRSPFPLRSLGALLLLLAGGAVFAQPTCSIDIGGDHVICEGESVTLNAPAGFPTRLWSTGATTPSITVAATGDYWCQVSYPSGNLVTNGNFTAGNTGFSTPFTYQTDLTTDPTYYVDQNASWHHPQFNATGNGNFLMVNAGWQQGWWDVWCQSVPVCPGQTYTLSFRGCSLSGVGAPVLEWYLDGNYAFGPYTMPNGPGVWQTYTANWTAPAGMTTANFCIKVVSAFGVGNDIGLDDISISGTIVLQDQVHVDVTPLPVFDLGPSRTVCQGQTTVLDATVPGGSYEWQDGSTAPTYTVTGPGPYSVEVTANGCSVTDNINIFYRSLPPADLGADLELCEGETVLLNAFVSGATYLWQNGSTAPTYTVTGPGPVSVTVTRLGCSNTSAIDVTYKPLPDVDLGTDVAICTGDPLVLDATVPGATYLWQDGSTNSTFPVVDSGPYEVEVDLDGCITTDLINVQVNTYPDLDLGPDVTLCAGEDTTFDLTGIGTSFLWNDGSTDPMFIVSDAGTYQVEVTRNGCTSTDEVEVFVNPVPGVDLGLDVELCAGDPFTLDVTTPNATYLWQDGSTGPTLDVIDSGPYSVEVTVNGCTGSDALDAVVHPLPDFDLGADRIVCPGTAVTFDATTAGATYLWNDGSTSPTFTTDQVGTYAVEVMLDGCSAFDEVTLSNFSAQAVDLGPDPVGCTGGTVPLAVDVPGATFLWSTGATSSTIDAASQGWYWVDATLNGCTLRDSVHVTFLPSPVIDLGTGPSVCPGDVGLLDATTIGASYLWSNGATTPSVNAAPGDWWVEVTVNGCTTSDAVTVTQRTPPALDLGNDTTLCPGADLLLSIGNPAWDVLWSDGSSAQTFTVTEDALVGVTVTDAFGCSSTDAITVTYTDMPSVVLGNDTSICYGVDLLLDATTPGATGYLWQNGSTLPTLTTSNNALHWVRVYFGTCHVTDEITVTTVAPPQVDLGEDATLCPGTPFLLDPGFSGFAHLWQDGSTASQFSGNTAGTYSVTVTNGTGCSGHDEIVIDYLEVADMDLGNDTTLCSGEQLVLSVDAPPGSVTWSTGATGPSITVTEPGDYWANINIQQCAFNESITVDFTELPAIDLGLDQGLCVNSTATLLAAAPSEAQLLWDDGSTEVDRTVTEGGTYWVRATLADCMVSDTILITDVPIPVVDLGNDTLICPGDAVALDASAPEASYLWSNGSALPGITVGTGTWTVAVTIQGCTGTDAITIGEAPSPIAMLPADTVLCADATWTVDVAQPGAAYLWQNGSTASTQTLIEGEYQVTVSIGACAITETVDVVRVQPIAVDLGPDTLICPYAELPLSVIAPGATVTWSTGLSAPSIVIAEAGTYAVSIDLSGCLSTDTIDVAVVELPLPDLGPDRILCTGDSMLLAVPSGSADVLWNDGSTADSLMVRNGGIYSVQLTTQGCISDDAVTITERPVIRSTELPEQTILCFGRTLTLDASLPDATYRWSTGATRPWIEVMDPGTYHVQVEGPCISAWDTVEVVPGDCVPLVHVPNAFTPDGDGVNDTYAAVTTGDFLEFSFMIFDRWGQLVFSTTTPGLGWDGHYNGQEAPLDVYTWRLFYRAVGDDGLGQTERLGSVTLVR